MPKYNFTETDLKRIAEIQEERSTTRGAAIKKFFPSARLKRSPRRRQRRLRSSRRRKRVPRQKHRRLRRKDALRRSPPTSRDRSRFSEPSRARNSKLRSTRTARSYSTARPTHRHRSRRRRRSTARPATDGNSGSIRTATHRYSLTNSQSGLASGPTHHPIDDQPRWSHESHRGFPFCAILTECRRRPAVRCQSSASKRRANLAARRFRRATTSAQRHDSSRVLRLDQDGHPTNSLRKRSSRWRPRYSTCRHAPSFDFRPARPTCRPPSWDCFADR